MAAPDGFVDRPKFALYTCMRPSNSVFAVSSAVCSGTTMQTINNFTTIDGIYSLIQLPKNVDIADNRTCYHTPA